MNYYKIIIILLVTSAVTFVNATRPTINKIITSFPGALRQEHFVTQLNDVLVQQGFKENSLLACSFCCDEINCSLENAIADLDLFGGSSFSLGGLAGFPFAGITGFCAFAHHIPESGNALIVIGPHVGVSSEGIIGKLNRRHHNTLSCSCGALCAARGAERRPAELLDTQQYFIHKTVRSLMPDARALESISDMCFLRKILQKQVTMLLNIIENSIKLNDPLQPKTKIAIVGGIHINTEDHVSDFFLPLFFEIRNSKGDVIKTIANNIF